MGSPAPPPASALDPLERTSEVLFGLIMALTFTGSLSVATADRGEVRTMLIGALGCNVAWGVIDALMFLMGRLNARGEELQALRSVQKARSSAEAHRVILAQLAAAVADELDGAAVERIRTRIAGMSLPPAGLHLGAADLKAAASVFMVVVASTFPLAVPFIFFKDIGFAMRISNAVAIAMLAFIGYAYGRASGLSPWWTASAMVLLGVLLVGLTIALGG